MISLRRLGRSDFELFGTIVRRGGGGQGILELFISKIRKTPWTSAQRRNRMLIGYRDPLAATGAPSGHRAQGCWVRQVDAGDLHDGLPRGFLAGAIVEVWLALRLNWA
jgi:hypothetical protein